jgi:F0F1-type ATP synthase assembly protein I
MPPNASRGSDPPDQGGAGQQHGPLPEGYSKYAGLGVQFAASIGVLGALGYWADASFGTRPWLMIVGIFLGAVGGFVSLIKQVPGPSPRRPPEDPHDSPGAR